MSEATLASAVAVPDQDNIRQSPEHPTKRRQSSVTDHDPKRRRLSSQADISPQSQRQQHSSPKGDVAPGQSEEKKTSRTGRKDDDRKRGQRLFGALLGTLSQSSSSAAQKRRADIEKKQQDKLKSQADEYDGLKRKKKERRDFIRRKETPFYEREAMQTRHANLIAAAHFLKTRTEPILCYKPWQYRPGDEAIIQDQIKEAEEIVSREVAAFEAQYPPEAFTRQDIVSSIVPTSNDEPEEQAQKDSAPAKPDASVPESGFKETEKPTEELEEKHEQVQSTEPDNVHECSTVSGEDLEHHDHRDDDGGEVLEDNEDTVMY
ncbi:uncharacterized protein N7483_011934 [Penicillium malachiteum]|uniref:uncharacterized protein n=1 Tax=Penicillium malachiteum TaxID=1324776 RepID=UPI002546F8DA|nr:uncharacterized protein N7483_011934 [Penicillium malachiteum]KAJ5714753.1 hypothetical protein N7483_011934 [Penicillium malachiteum]